MEILTFDTPLSYWNQTNWARCPEGRLYFRPAAAKKPVLRVLRNGLRLADVLDQPVAVTIEAAPPVCMPNLSVTPTKKVSVFQVAPSRARDSLTPWLAGLEEGATQDHGRRSPVRRRGSSRSAN